MNKQTIMNKIDNDIKDKQLSIKNLFDSASPQLNSFKGTVICAEPMIKELEQLVAIKQWLQLNIE